MYKKRYGMDTMNKALLIVAGVFAVLSLVLTFTVGYSGLATVAVALLAIALFRIMSRNFTARQRELMAWGMLTQRIKGWWNAKKFTLKDRRVNKYLICPVCKQQLRVPKGKGNLNVTCARCGNKFKARS